MLHFSAEPCLARMIEAYEEVGGNIIAVAPVPEEETHKYGIVGVNDPNGRVSEITTMVEKPKPADAPSNLHITGRYVLQPEIFELLEKQAPGAGNEIQLTDAMLELLSREDQRFHAVRFDGDLYDCGSKLGFLMANVAYGLRREDLGPDLRREISALLAKD
jgi:UTP--glucose-1-phosphate uridylyltransferase